MRMATASDGWCPAPDMFLFFSNLGCLGSLLVSAILTIVLLVILGVL